MSDLIDAPTDGLNAPEFSVSEISGVVKRMIEGEFSHIRIRGEVGRVSRPASGHLYLDLKDDRSVLASVIWKGVASRLRTKPEEGMEVVATGKLTTFPGQSRYQMVIEDIAPAGVGALMAMLEKRKKALASEGLFNPERKQRLPYLPEVIGVVTSPSGAVIRDILHRLRDRFPRKVLIWPVAVQGSKCAAEVSAAIDGFNALSVGGAMPRPDLIIVARGGGSIEDLWGFNEEIVVRAAAASAIPLISAVGHETDTTLIDYASDQRAPTPTAAAELAVPVRADLMAWLAGMEERRVRALVNAIDAKRQRLRDLSRALPNPADLVALQSQRLDHLVGRLPRGLQSAIVIKRANLDRQAAGLRPIVLQRVNDQRKADLAVSAKALMRAPQRHLELKGQRLRSLRIPTVDHIVTAQSKRLEQATGRFGTAAQRQITDWRRKLENLERLRETLGYTATLERGYAVVRDGDGALVSTKKAAKAATNLDIQFKDGTLSVGPSSKPARKPKVTPTPEQGSLF